MGTGEFDLIARIRARAGTRDDIVLGIGDDAALLAPPPGRHLVVTADTLNDGVHFPHGTPPADIGWKALAVNLSDLASMGAEPGVVHAVAVVAAVRCRVDRRLPRWLPRAGRRARHRTGRR